MNKKITLEDIKQEIALIEGRLAPDPNKLKGIYDQINKKVSEFTLAVGANESEKADGLSAELTELHRQEKLEKSLIYAIEHGQMKEAIRNNSTIKSMVKEFEKDTLDELKELSEGRKKAIEKFKEARLKLLKAIYNVGEFNLEYVKRSGELEFVRQYNENPIGGNVSYASQFELISFNNLDILPKARNAWFAGCNKMGLEYLEDINNPKKAEQEVKS